MLSANNQILCIDLYNWIKLDDNNNNPDSAGILHQENALSLMLQYICYAGEQFVSSKHMVFEI